MSPTIPVRSHAVLEVTAVALTALLHVIFYDVLHARGVFIVVTILAWSTYFALRIRQGPDSRREYGLTTDGLRSSAIATLVVFLIGGAICMAYALSRGRLVLVPSMLIVALLYPIWGLLQQLLVQTMVVRNLAPHISRPVVVVVAAILFGAVHLPDPTLTVVTAVLGGALTLIFMRWRNIWPLGVCHGWLGVLFYYWVLHRDPWLEIITKT